MISCCHLLSLVVIRFHWLYHSLPLVAPFVFIRCHSLSFVVALCHPLSFDVSLVYLFINDRTKICEANFKIQNEDFGQCVNQVVCSLDYRNISCCASENILSKVILEYHVSMLNLSSRVSQHQLQNIQRKNNFSQSPQITEKVLRIFEGIC